MTILSDVKSEDMETLRTRLSRPTIGTYERELVIRAIQKLGPNPKRKPGKLTKGLLDAQLDWIDSL